MNREGELLIVVGDIRLRDPASHGLLLVPGDGVGGDVDTDDCEGRKGGKSGAYLRDSFCQEMLNQQHNMAVPAFMRPLVVEISIQVGYLNATSPSHHHSIVLASPSCSPPQGLCLLVTMQLAIHLDIQFALTALALHSGAEFGSLTISKNAHTLQVDSIRNCLKRRKAGDVADHIYT